jgi:AcrR family transcriptional regulator
VNRPRRDQVILDALEGLLPEHALSALSVEQIAEAAGVTRTRFYHYYGSKQAAFAALLRRTAEDSFAAAQSAGTWFERPATQRPRQALAMTLREGALVMFAHPSVLREAPDLWNALPEVRAIWRRIWAVTAAAVAAAIRRERELGVAPPGADPDRIAQALLWGGERLQFVSAIGGPGALDVDAFAEINLDIWMRAIYRADDPDPCPEIP